MNCSGNSSFVVLSQLLEGKSSILHVTGCRRRDKMERRGQSVGEELLHHFRGVSRSRALTLVCLDIFNAKTRNCVSSGDDFEELGGKSYTAESYIQYKLLVVVNNFLVFLNVGRTSELFPPPIPCNTTLLIVILN